MANQNGKQKAYEPGTLALFAGLGVFMSILGVVSLLAVVGGVQGMAFEKIKQVMQGLGGSLCIGISVLLIWGGALCMFTAGKNVPKRSYFAMLVLFLAVLGIFNLLSSVGTQGLMDYGVQYNQTQYSPPLAQADGYWNLIRFGYRISSGSGVFGGALGMLLAWPAWTFLGKTFGVAVLGQVVTLPVEFNASRRALESLEGGYLLEKEGEMDAELLSRALQLAKDKLKERDRYISGLEKENALNTLKLDLQAPKVHYFDQVLRSSSTYTATQIAKELGMSGRELNMRLKALGIQFRQSGTWLLTARYQKEGYTRTHTHSWQSRCGETGTAMHTVWTEKGRLFIHCLFSGLSLF